MADNFKVLDVRIDEAMLDWWYWAMWSGIDSRCGTSFAARFQQDELRSAYQMRINHRVAEDVARLLRRN